MALILALIVSIFILLALIVFYVVCWWKIYTKAGQPGWACIVPIYGIILYFKIIGKPWWWIFMLLIPIYGQIVIPIIMIHKLSKAFGHDVGFTLGLIFLSFIFIPILAFENSNYANPGTVIQL